MKVLETGGHVAVQATADTRIRDGHDRPGPQEEREAALALLRYAIAKVLQDLQRQMRTDMRRRQLHQQRQMQNELQRLARQRREQRLEQQLHFSHAGLRDGMSLQASLQEQAYNEQRSTRGNGLLESEAVAGNKAPAEQIDVNEITRLTRDRRA